MFVFPTFIRPWYTETKERQMGTWHDVFPFFTLGLGITYSLPYYKTIDDDRKVFDGVLAVDYRCKLCCVVAEARNESASI